MALAQAAETPTERAALWRQLVDLVAQFEAVSGEHVIEAVRDRIEGLRSDVSLADRRSTATALAGRCRSVTIVTHFATDHPTIAAIMLSSATLAENEWLAVLRVAPPASRALLRNRRDLGPTVERALASFGASDLGLPEPEAAPGEAPPTTQIRDLVARIEAFRRARPAPETTAGEAPVDESVSHFDFETTAGGLIDWVSMRPREAVIGLSIAEAADPGGAGADGHAAGAFRRRSPFADARLLIAGNGAVAGLWLITAAPRFNPRDGRFAGYHGHARRPMAQEMVSPASASGTADSLRQIVHELRTPLNAIQGFAEMINRQLLGPAASDYRIRAQRIEREARALVELIEDVECLARGPDVDSVGAIDVSEVLTELPHFFAEIIAERQLDIDIRVTPVIVRGFSPKGLTRLARRLLGSLLIFTEQGERLVIETSGDETIARIAISKPSGLADVKTLFVQDGGHDPEERHPREVLLSLSFSLRLVARSVKAGGGQLVVNADTVELMLEGVEHTRASGDSA